MARLNRFGFLAIAVVFHLLYIYSIFDIYFVSPIVHGMQAYSVASQNSAFSTPPAKRLVLIVGDGLRADKAFQSFPNPSLESSKQRSDEAQPLAPFIRSRVEEHGTFGVSHTRVPTESRPGHVALIAGLYEDVSAVMTGWKLNPVNFDSVFNRSRHTWSWGSPDILAMFKEGAEPGRVDAEMYSEELEDYTLDATLLDTWVFERVEKMFTDAATDSELDARLRMDKNVFFLHLLGLDTTGHAYRPYSKEYLRNIQIVDQGVEQMTKLIEDFYGDGETAFVFTADHGMSDWGSHGDGHPDNTRTPLVAWGAGVHKSIISKDRPAPGHEDGFSSDWGLDHIARHDVAQADVAALMAYLVGLEFPVNSVGELPLPYLSSSLSEKAEASLVNARGVLEAYRVKEELKRATELRYKPFAAFAEVNGSIEDRVARVRAAIDEGQVKEAIQGSQDLIRLGLEGLRYLQTYDWLFLRALVTMGYLGWIVFAITTVIDLHVLGGTTPTSRTFFTNAAFSSALVGLFSYLVVRRSPVTYYVYAFFPVLFWEEVVANRQALVKGKDALLGHVVSQQELIEFMGKAAASVILLEALVLSYFRREVYSICYLAAIFWPLVYGRRFVEYNKTILATWSVACTLMSTFTLLPAVKTESSTLILSGGFLMFCVGVLYIVFEESLSSSSAGALASAERSKLSRNVMGIQVGQIVLAMLVTRSSVASLQAKQGLPLGNQIMGWLVLITSLSIPFLHSMQPNNHYLHRLAIIFLTFSPTFIILTISYEGLFYFAFCITLVTWVRLEHHVYTFHKNQQASPLSPPPSPKPISDAISSISSQLSDPKEGDEMHQYRPLTLSDFRVAIFFLFLLQSAFFSTGNIASVSSFSLESVYRLIPVFNPFSQGALLILKLMIPFAVISANLGILNRRLGVAPSSLFMIVMAISDVLTLNFFWMVKDEGSWLDIGTTISHFVIASLLCAFVALLEFMSEIFVGGVEVGDELGGRNAPRKAAANGSPKPTEASIEDEEEDGTKDVSGDDVSNGQFRISNGHGPTW